MSKDACIYSKVNGTEAYLAGIVEVYTERCLQEAFKKIPGYGYGYSLTSDVFGLGKNNELNIKQAIRKRIDERCFDLLFDKGEPPKEQIEIMISGLEISKMNVSIEDAIKELIKIAIKNVEFINDDILEYCRDLEWYLGKPLNVYNVRDNKDLFTAYEYLIFGTIFIEYEEFAVMLNIGTSD